MSASTKKIWSRQCRIHTNHQVENVEHILQISAPVYHTFENLLRVVLQISVPAYRTFEDLLRAVLQISAPVYCILSTVWEQFVGTCIPHFWEHFKAIGACRPHFEHLLRALLWIGARLPHFWAHFESSFRNIGSCRPHFKTYFDNNCTYISACLPHFYASFDNSFTYIGASVSEFWASSAVQDTSSTAGLFIHLTKIFYEYDFLILSQSKYKSL